MLKKYVIIVSCLMLSPYSKLVAQNCSASLEYMPPGNIVQQWSGTTVNQLLNQYAPGTIPPFDVNCPVLESVPTKNTYLVRFYASNGGSPIGSYLVNPNLVRNLTPEQIRDVLALPTLPDKVEYVRIPAGNQYGFWTGIAAPINGWGQGGAVQTKVIGYHGDSANFENYTYLPLDSYLNDQFIGRSALSYAPYVSEGNAGSVARYLDAHLPQPYSDLADVYTTLDFINADGRPELARALIQISPINFDSYNFVELRSDLLFEHQLLNHQMLNEDKKSLSFWSDAAGEAGKLYKMDVTGFNYLTGLLAGGVDFYPQPQLKIGLGAAYLQNNINWKFNKLGNAIMDNAKLGIYSQYLFNDYFLSAALTGGYQWGSAQRKINFAGDGIGVLSGAILDTLSVNQVATSNPTGQNLGLHLQTGRNLKYKDWQFSPRAQIAYFYSGQNPFHERGANALNLNIDSFSAQTLRSQLAFVLEKNLLTSQGHAINSDIGLGWANYLPLDNRVLTANLPSLGGSFHVNGYNKVLNTALLSADLTSTLTSQSVLLAQYKAELSSGFTSQLLALTLKYNCDRN